MRAVILVGRGQAEPGTGASLIRLAARCRMVGIAPIMAAGFLQHQRPSFGEALKQCIARGAREAIIVPYALSLAEKDRADLERTARDGRAMYPHLALHVTDALGHHRALMEVFIQRVIEADYVAAHHIYHRRITWPGWEKQHAIGLLIVGKEMSTIPVNLKEAITTCCPTAKRYAAVRFFAVGQDGESMESSLEALIAQGCRSIIVAPYTLEKCRVMATIIECAVAGVCTRYPDVTIIQAEPLAYDRRLITAIAERVRATVYGL
ncbi:MAG: sirohydrochlorin chelatase [Roseiflexus sp.]